VTLEESQNADDEVLKIEGLTILINKRLRKKLGSLKIYVEEGKGLAIEQLKK